MIGCEIMHDTLWIFWVHLACSTVMVFAVILSYFLKLFFTFILQCKTFSLTVECFGCAFGTTNFTMPSPTGSWTTLFVNRSFPCDGFLTKMVYKSQAVGDFYLDIWKTSGNGFIHVNKKEVTATKIGIEVWKWFKYICHRPLNYHETFRFAISNFAKKHDSIHLDLLVSKIVTS